MRLFTAIELPDDLRQHLVRVRHALRGEARQASFTRDENLHITLKFLGEAHDQQIQPLTQSLAKIQVAGGIQLQADAVECFPDRGPVRIVAARFGGDMKRLDALHRAIEQRCQHLVFAPENRTFRPHATLARARPTLPARVREMLARLAAELMPGPAMVADEFSLMESRLLPAGSQYVSMARFRFAV